MDQQSADALAAQYEGMKATAERPPDEQLRTQLEKQYQGAIEERDRHQREVARNDLIVRACRAALEQFEVANQPMQDPYPQGQPLPEDVCYG